MRAVYLFFQLTLYYAVCGLIIFLGFRFLPGLKGLMPIGGAQSLLSQAGNDPFAAIEVGTSQISNIGESLIWICIAVLGSVLTSLPVSWTYIACRKRDEYDNSIIRTIIILPMLLTSIVLMVHNSLALAFSLAGIVGAVRFRNTLKSPGDALYILMAIAIGLSAGIGAIEIAVAMTILVNYAFVVLWVTEFGVKDGSQRYMRRPYENIRKKGLNPALSEEQTEHQA